MVKKAQLFLLSLLLTEAIVAQSTPPKNIIFMVGDGMGTTQVYTAIVAMKGKSNFEKFPYTGFSKTYSYNNFTTDSGAGGSALFTGGKVNNHAIAMSPEGKPLTTLLEKAQQNEKGTGFVVTSIVNCATPAATYAHVFDRKQFDSITMQLANSNIDIFIGGGSQYFKKENRNDGLSPIDTLKNREYEIVYSLQDLIQTKKTKIAGLLTPDYPGNREIRGNMLMEGTRKAIEQLKINEHGFVLMIEGSQIDWACHDTNGMYLKNEMVEFDSVIGEVLNFAKHDGNTLVIVTADHETGGVTLPKGNWETGTLVTKFTTTHHTGVMVPIFAFGPGAENFVGIMENTEIYNKIMEIMNWR